VQVGMTDRVHQESGVARVCGSLTYGWVMSSVSMVISSLKASRFQAQWGREFAILDPEVERTRIGGHLSLMKRGRRY
jgi:hypothetical protein